MGTVDVNREELERLEERAADWVQSLQDLAESIDEDHSANLRATNVRFATGFNRDLDRLELDDGSRARIRGALLEAIDIAERAREEGPLDVVTDLMLRAEAIRHVLRDAMDVDIGVDPSDAGALAGRLTEWLPHASQGEIAALVDISARQFARWLKDGGRASRRLLLVARLVSVLRLAWTDEGVIAWFGRPRADLDGKAALDVLDDPDYERRLLAAVRRGRGMHGG